LFNDSEAKGHGTRDNAHHCTETQRAKPWRRGTRSCFGPTFVASPIPDNR
jgi:hypothetical protein